MTIDKQTRVEVTIRVVPMDTAKPITSKSNDYLFTDESEALRADIIGNAARALYPLAAGVHIPTPPKEGGR